MWWKVWIVLSFLQQLSDVSTAESFLSKVISRNRPRVILFSPHRHPSLRYKLAALAHVGVADCAFVSTHQMWLNQDLLDRFKVHPGNKKMLVLKEDYGRGASQHFSVSGLVTCTCSLGGTVLGAAANIDSISPRLYSESGPFRGEPWIFPAVHIIWPTNLCIVLCTVCW